ncbi:MAG: 1,4-alpha-glucan branching protein GlgB [Myxococcaceae bacterium]|nr:1,4-alpha-glucan branching protein GlgB [Myxococcaceae bacterium]
MTKLSDPAEVERQIAALTELRHPDPHALLGIHPEGDGVVIRAFRPNAEKVVALPDGGGRVELRHLSRGVFEGRVTNTELFRYRLEVTYPGNRVFTFRDPYSFLPTLGELDLHLIGEGRHERLWERLGAHPLHHHGVAGTAFAVWAPTAASVSVVGDFNGWDGRLHPMRRMGASGVWELFIPEVGEGTRYKFEIRPQHGGPFLLKADPLAFRTEVPPLTASVVHDLGHYPWGDASWLAQRAKRAKDVYPHPFAIYELHLGSWRHVVEDAGRPLTYREIAPALADYVKQQGFTHVELLPIAEHPYGGSWGYQVTGYYAPTARYGHPDDLRYLIDYLHQHEIGVIVDWVPGHFPKDAHGLGRFDGTALYEHADPRQGTQPDWGTLVFNFGRNEVKNFLVANALFWIDQYHVDGLRVDAVASMLYLDYSRPPGQWIPNRSGGRENLEAIAFLREMNDAVRRLHPGVVTIAEESTAWPKVSQPISEGGLGFHFKWNMGWMHDTLLYFSKDPIHRRFHHNNLTFGLLYAFSEHFVLPLSHDEVVHGKGSLLAKMPGDEWQKFANLRALFGWMWSHPGKKLLFMGGEFGQGREWSEARSLDWHQLEHWGHRGLQKLVADLNRLYVTEPALFEQDDMPLGFQWLQADAAEVNVFAFVRWPKNGERHLVCAANLAPVPRERYRIGFPKAGPYVEALNTDAEDYGGSGMGNLGQVVATEVPWDGQPASAEVTLPPLSVVWFTPS